MTPAFTLWLCCSLLPLAPPPGVPVELAPDTLVVCPGELRPGLTPWLEYRRDQGHSLAVLTEFRSAQQIRDVVRRVAAQGRLRHLVLVGDVQPDEAQRSREVPTYFAEARINTRWGSEPEIATDNWYVDLNDDTIPELAVGRIPADNVAELRLILDKAIAYERSQIGGTWRRKVNLVAGVGGFGLLADTVLETATRSFIQTGIPESYQTSMTYASWRSPYCPDPRSFRQQVVRRLNEGCLCWVYVGHGQRDGLDWVRVPIGVAPILKSEDTVRLDCAGGPPIAVFLSCYGAAFDGAEDCLAERMVQQPQGPVAAIGGSRVTMPYGMACLSQSLMQQMFQERPATLGEMLLVAKQQTMAPPGDGPQRPWLDTLAKTLSPNSEDLEGERREHVLLFHLIGDPLLRIRHPETIEIDAPKKIAAGQPLPIRCRSAMEGKCTIELACRRGRFTFRPEARREFDATHAGMRALDQVYERANDDRFTSVECAAQVPEFAAQLTVPAAAVGACTIRVFVENGTAFGVGSAVVFVAAPPVQTGQAEENTATAARAAPVEPVEPVKPVTTRSSKAPAVQ